MNTGEILTRIRRKWNKESQEAEPSGAQGRLLQLLARGRAPQAELFWGPGRRGAPRGPSAEACGWRGSGRRVPHGQGPGVMVPVSGNTGSRSQKPEWGIPGGLQSTAWGWITSRARGVQGPVSPLVSHEGAELDVTPTAVPVVATGHGDQRPLDALVQVGRGRRRRTLDTAQLWGGERLRAALARSRPLPPGCPGGARPHCERVRESGKRPSRPCARRKCSG